MKAGGLPTRVAVLLALLALTLGGGPAAMVSGLALVLVLVPGPTLSGPAWLIAHSAALAGAGLWASAGAYQEALALLVGWLLVHRAWVGRTAADARTGLLFALLLALLACLQADSLVVGLVLVAFSAILPAALLRVEVGEVAGLRGRAVIAGVGVVLLGTVLFFALPRLHGGFFARGGGTGGLGGSVVLGDDDVPNDAVLVARFKVTDAAGGRVGGPFYLRGRALDRFDGRSWTTTLGMPDPVVPRVDGWELQAQLELEPALGGILLGPPEVVQVQGLGSPAWRDLNGTWHHRAPPGRLQYTVRFRRLPATEPPFLPDHLRASLLQLPELDPRVRELARALSPDETDPRRLATALTDHLARTYAYLDTPSAPDGDPLAHFLFQSRRGHCEYFASALAVMLRERGVPARVGTGFYTDEVDLDGEHYLARTSHAHAWVEVPLASGWTVFDPTPVGGRAAEGGGTLAGWLANVQDRWIRVVVEYDLGDQFTGLEALGRGFAEATGQEAPAVPARSGVRLVLGGMVILYALAVLAQLFGNRVLIERGPRPDALARQVAAARRLVVRRGWTPPEGLPPLAEADWLVAQVGDAAEPYRELARVLYQARYAPGPPPADALARAKACVRALDRLPPRAQADRRAG